MINTYSQLTLRRWYLKLWVVLTQSVEGLKNEPWDFPRKEQFCLKMYPRNLAWVSRLLVCSIEFGIKTVALTPVWVSSLMAHTTDFRLASLHSSEPVPQNNSYGVFSLSLSFSLSVIHIYILYILISYLYTYIPYVYVCVYISPIVLYFWETLIDTLGKWAGVTHSNKEYVASKMQRGP